MKIRYATKEDLPQILEVANRAFGEVREEGFDFRSIMPKAYADGVDCSSYHLVAEEDGIVSVAGNLPLEIITGGESYPFSVVGTVSTLPEYQGKGYMRALMERVMGDSAKNCVFSLLSGIRDRYRRYGFERFVSSYEFIFNGYLLQHSTARCVQVRPYCKDDFEEIYRLYLDKKPVTVRSRESFLLCLRTSASQIFVLTEEGRPVGYYAYSARKNSVNELLYRGENVEGVITGMMRYHASDFLKICVTPFDTELCKQLDAIAECKLLVDKINLCVFDWRRFLSMALSLKHERCPLPEGREIYSIDGVCYAVQVQGNAVSVQCTDEAAPASLCFTSQSFIRNAVGLVAPFQSGVAQYLPLTFCLDESDMF